MGAAVFLAGAPCSQAHLVNSGLGPVYDGIGHFFLSPEDAIAALVLALMAGQRGSASGRSAIWTIPAVWLAAGLAGVLWAGTLSPSVRWPSVAISFSLLVPGILVAADLRLPPWLGCVIGIASAGLHGFLNGSNLREAGAWPAALSLLGVSFAVFVVVVIFSAAVVSLKIPWTRVAVRVAGSWIAATGLLLLGWAFRRGG